MDPPTRLLFLPGASGNTAHWRPVAERLAHGGERIHPGWPLQAALAAPRWITHLVLTVTSGGVPMAEQGAEDWREAFRLAHPRLPSVAIPTLLLWGDADPISPAGVGRRLASLLPAAHLFVVGGGTHDLAMERAEEIAPLIDRHQNSFGR